MAGEVTRVRVRPAIKRLVWWVGPVLLLIAAWQIWDAVEARRLERALAVVQQSGASPKQEVAPGNDDAARYYAAAAIASIEHYHADRTIQVAPREPLKDVAGVVRDALSRGVAPPAQALDVESHEMPLNDALLDLIRRASALEFGSFRPGTEFNFRWSGSMHVNRAAGLRTLDLVMKGQGDAAAAVLFDRVKALRAFDGEGLNDFAKTRFVKEIATDVGILVGQAKPSDKNLADLDRALVGAFSVDELALSIRGQALSFSETISGVWRRTGSGMLLRPLFRHHLVAYLQTTADAMQAARLPWPDRMHAMARVPERHSVLPEVPRFIWAWRKNEVLRNQTLLLGEGLAAVRGARLVIKVEQFRRVNDRLPDTLSELTVATGDEVLDPFTGKPLLYARDGDGYVVYSVGRDQRDNGGRLLVDTPSSLPMFDVGVRVFLSRQPAAGSRQ